MERGRRGDGEGKGREAPQSTFLATPLSVTADTMNFVDLQYTFLIFLIF